MGQGAARRFEFDDGKSSKFWEIEVTGAQFTVRYGKIGTTGQTQTKEFADAAAAGKAADKLIAEKVGKGYQQVGRLAQTVASDPGETTPAPAKESAKPSKVAAAPKPADIAKDPEADSAALDALAGSNEAIDRLLAKHSKASATLLEKLSHSSDKATRNHVVLHPNAPKEVLVKLAHQFPADFFKNPAFDWLLLEAPDLMQRIGGNVLGTLLKRPDCPQSFLNWAVKHGTEKERLAVAMNAEACEEALRELVGQGGAAGDAARGHAKLASDTGGENPQAALEAEVRKELGVFRRRAGVVPVNDTFGSPDSPDILELALTQIDDAIDAWNNGAIGPVQWCDLSPETRLEVLDIDLNLVFQMWMESELSHVQLAKYGNVAARKLLSSNISEFISLLVDAGVDFRTAGAIHETRLKSKLGALIGSEAWKRHVSAGNDPCPIFPLEILASDAESSVREDVAENPACPIPLLETLAQDAKSSVRIAVARNPACPVTLLETLARDEYSDVRAAVANHPAFPVNLRSQLLEPLARDTNSWFRNSVAKNPACPVPLLETLVSDAESSVRIAVARNPACPVTLLETLARDEYSDVRVEVAKHPAFPVNLRIQLLEPLARDTKSWIRSSVASNSACPVPLLETLASDAESSVRIAVARNPACPVTLLETLARDEYSDVRAAVANHPACPVPLLEALARDKDGGVRSSVAENPACPVRILQRLTEDGRSDVWVAAAQNPASLAFSADWASSRNIDVLWAFGTTQEDIPDSLRYAIFSALLRKCAPRQRPESGVRRKRIRSLDTLVLLRGKYPVGGPHLPLDLVRRPIPWIDLGATKDLVILAGEGLCPPAIRRRAVALQLASEDYPLIARQYGTESLFREELAALGDENQSEFIEAEVEALLFRPADSLLGRLIGANKEASRLSINNHVADFAARSKNPALRLLGLSSPVTSPATLGKSSRSTEWAERLAVAMNPSCPPAVINRLKTDGHHLVAGGARIGEQRRVAREAERAVLMANPPNVDRERLVVAIQERLPLEQGNWLGLSNELIRSRWQASLKLCQIFPRSKIADPAYPPELLRILATNQDSSIRESVAENPTCPVDVLEQLANDRSPHVRVKLLENPASTIAILKTLARDKKERWRLIDAKYPEDVLRIFVKGRDRSDRRRLAELNDCPVAILNSLAADKDASVKAAVAANPSCPAEVRKHILETIYQDEWDVVRKDVAQNPHCPVSILEALATDADRGVRSAVAENSTCPASILEVLAKEDDRDVRIAVAGNGNCPVQLRLRLLEALAKHEVSYVREAVAKNLACPASILETLAKDEYLEVRKAVAEHAVCPSSVLGVLAKDDGRGDSRPMMGGKADVRRAVAANPACPYPTLEALANDEDDRVRMAVARNPSCPIPLLEALRKDENRFVRYSAASSQRERTNDTSDQAPESSLEKMASDRDSRKRIDAAENLDCPARILEGLVKDESLDVRAAVAKNPNCPSRYLNVLIEDKDPWIAYLAIFHRNATKSQLVRWASDGRLHPELRLYSTRQPAFPSNAERLVREVRDLATAKPELLENVTDDELDVAFNALDIAPDSDTAAVKAVKSDDWLQRAAAICCHSSWLQPHQLKLMLDDPAAVVRQLAVQQLREREKAAT